MISYDKPIKFVNFPGLCYDCPFRCNSTKNIKDTDVVNCDGKFCGQYIADDGDILMAFCVPQRYNDRGTFCEFHSWEEKIQRCHCVGDLCNGKSNYNKSLTENDIHREEDEI